MPEEKEKFGIGISDDQQRLKYLYGKLKDINWQISSRMKIKKQLEKEIREIQIRISRQKQGIYLEGEIEDEQ